jgi:hypothetical protein
MREFDYKALKSRTWNNEIVSRVAQIHEYKGRQELYLAAKPTALDRLIEIARIQSTEGSNSIEGIRTTGPRLRQLVANKTTPKNRDEEEILGYRNVLDLIHESYEYIPVRPSYILQLHRDLLRYISVIAEKTRNAAGVLLGVSPRGAISLLKVAKGFALLGGRSYITPDDVKKAAVPTLAHRLVLTGSQQLKRDAAREIIEEILENTPVPTEANFDGIS